MPPKHLKDPLPSSSAMKTEAAIPTPLAVSAKRKKIDDMDTNGVLKKKPRTRVSYSCGECHRRKQKCDRQVPCSHCIARKVPELCKAYTPGKTDQDIHARLARLEQIVEMALPQFSSGSTPGSPAVNGSGNMSRGESGSMSPIDDDDDASQAEEGDVGGGSFESGKWFGNTVSGSVAPATMLEQLQHVNQVHDALPRDSRQHHTPRIGHPVTSQNVTFDDEPDSPGPVLNRAEPTASDNLQSLIRDCGLSENKLSELLKELPPPKLTETLIDYYFKDMNWTRYPISESDFRTSYEALFHETVGSNPSDMSFLPLLFVVLAIAVRLAPEHIAGDARTKRLRSQRYYWTSRRALLIAAAIQPDSVEIVFTRLLSARYLTFDRRITECWSQLGAAVCSAQALGLHRDPAAMHMEPAQVEYRRRIWAYLYHADRSYALVLGRPYAIQDEYTSTQPPLNIEDPSTLPTSGPITPPSLSKPTRMSFVVLRHHLAAIIGRIVHHFQVIRAHRHYSEVIALDDELQRFIDNLPAHFSMQPDTSLDKTEEYIPLHRYLLITEILFVRISLHRPYLLRRLDTDRYARSRRACFNSAIMDYEVRQAYRRTQTKEMLTRVSNAYREFSTAMIAGIYLVLDPNGKDADVMHAILDTFMNDHEGTENLEDTTCRELKIVEFLKEKASQAGTRVCNGRKMSVDAGSSHPSEQSMDAQANLLLSLQQSRGMVGQRQNGDVTLQRAQYVTSNGHYGMDGPPLTNGHLPPQSPTFQRVQNDVIAISRNSPAGSGSPSAEEDSAQSLLDHWVNTVNNPPPLMDGFMNGAWGAFATGSADASQWLNTPYLMADASMTTTGVEVADCSFWENLVNQIRGGPVQ